MIESILNLFPSHRRLREEHEALRCDVERRDTALRSIEAVCREAARGNLEPRILGLGHDDALAQVARSINHLLDLTDAYVRESTVSLTASVDGRFYRRFLERGMLGSFQVGASTINAASAHLEAKTSVLEEVSELLHRMSSGDFTGSLSGSHSGAYARLQENLNCMTASMRTMLEEIRGAAAMVAVSSDDLEVTSRGLSAAADNTSLQIQSVSAASIQAGYNVQTVAAAAEELSASIKEINQHLQNAAGVSAEAANSSATIVSRMDALAQSSAEIDSVINVINDFARQTNLLALNASIEAARAGDAGRGFLVVASQVGQLANQTASATDKIAGTVRNVQALVTEATTGIRHAADTVRRLGEINSWIAGSMSEQTLVTSDIARNVTEAAIGTDEAARGVSAVADGARSTAGGASKSLEASERLAEIALSLDKMLGRFRT
jgi:methyl-accepting chemotaxis protein